MIKNLAVKLKALRLLRGMHQKDLVNATGIHITLIVDFERGRAFPAPEQLQALEQALGIRFNDETEAAFATLAPELEAANV